MASSMIYVRGISTSCINYGKRNFRKFKVPNKLGSVAFKKVHNSRFNDGENPIDTRGTREAGFVNEYKEFVYVKEREPELVVPDLKDFPLKAYVSYKLGKEEVEQPEFTPQELFNRVYAQKIIEDYEKDGLLENGEPKNPSPYEKMTPAEAKANASKTGTDLFTDGDKRPSWEY